MLEIIRGLKAVQQQLDLLMAQLVSLVPDSGDRVAEMCNALAHTPVCVAETVSVNPYEPLLPGIWLGFAKKTAIQVRQHKRADTGSENRSYALTVSTGPEFQSNWLTLEFSLTRAEIVTRNALSIDMEVSSNVAGSVRFAVKAHGRDVEPKFTELAKYEIDGGILHITDVALLGRSVPGMSEEFHDIRVMLFLPAVANATFAFSLLRLALL